MTHDQNSTVQRLGATAALAALGLTPGHEKHAGILSWIANQAGRPFAWGGEKLLAGASKAGVPEATTSAVGKWGKGLAAEMGGFGLFGGGLEAAMAEPGERPKAFARGFGTGALQGLGWGVGTRAVGSTMGKLMPKGRFEELEKTKLWGRKPTINKETGAIERAAAPRKPDGSIDWGTRGKALGAKALPWMGGFMGSEAVGAPFGQSMLFNKSDKPVYAYPQTYGPMLGLQPNDGMGTAGMQAGLPY